MTALLFAIAFAIGISLGLLGAGGAIVAVPALVYIGNITPTLASGYAMFVVAVSTLIASVRVWHKGLINWKAFWAFGISTMLTIYSIRHFIVPNIPEQVGFASLLLPRDWLLMMAFGLVLLSAGVGMLRRPRTTHNVQPPHPMRLAALGVIVGIVAGFLGVGGGFLMTPALAIWARLDMKHAVATSLALICVNSSVGVAADVSAGVTYDWQFVGIFTVLSVIGIFVGLYLSHRIHSDHLKKIFGALVITIGVAVLIKELI